MVVPNQRNTVKTMLGYKNNKNRKRILNNVGVNSTLNISTAVNGMTPKQFSEIVKILFPLPNNISRKLNAREKGKYPNPLQIFNRTYPDPLKMLQEQRVLRKMIEKYPPLKPRPPNNRTLSEFYEGF